MAAQGSRMPAIVISTCRVVGAASREAWHCNATSIYYPALERIRASLDTTPMLQASRLFVAICARRIELEAKIMVDMSIVMLLMSNRQH